jgi:hypothetical protein
MNGDASGHDPAKAAQLPHVTSLPQVHSLHVHPLRGDSTKDPIGLVIPRGLVMLTALWVFASWLFLFGTNPPIQAQSASYGPTIQMLFALVGVGVGIAWPLLRLTGQRSRQPVAQALVDGLAIVVLLQVVIWPLRLVTTWSLPRTVGVHIALILSVCCVGALLSIAHASSNPRTRTAAMALLVALVAIPPCVWAVLPESWVTFHLLAVSPPALLGTLAAAVPLDPTTDERALLQTAAWVASHAVVAALLVAGVRHWRASHASRSSAMTD